MHTGEIKSHKHLLEVMIACMYIHGFLDSYKSESALIVLLQCWYLQDLDMCSLPVDEPSVKIEQDNLNKPAS